MRIKEKSSDNSKRTIEMLCDGASEQRCDAPYNYMPVRLQKDALLSEQSQFLLHCEMQKMSRAFLGSCRRWMDAACSTVFLKPQDTASHIAS